MIRRSTFLAVAASAVLGLAMLSVTEASARGHGGGGGGGGMHGGGHGGGMHGGGHGGGMRMVGGRGHHGGHEGHRPHHRHPHWHVRYHRPIWYGVRTVGYTYGATATRVAGPCTCLSKEYTQDGRVLFKDLCTNEAAINPPVVVPRQSSLIDAPVQQASNAVQYQAAPANALPQVDPLTGAPK
jgi:hypothetical protein